MNNYLGSVASSGMQLAAYVVSCRDDPEPVVLVFFGDHKPARKVVGCGELPFGARVMIDAIAGNWEGTPPVA